MRLNRIAQPIAIALAISAGAASAQGNDPVTLPDGSIAYHDLIWTPVPDEQVTFDQAADKCGGTLLGRTGWRLPTRKELVKICSDCERTLAPKRVKAAFSGGFALWSSDAGDEPGKHAMYFQERSLGNKVGPWSDKGAGNYTCVRPDDRKANQEEASKSTEAPVAAKKVDKPADPRVGTLHFVTDDTEKAELAKTQAAKDRQLAAASKNEANQRRQQAEAKKAAADKAGHEKLRQACLVDFAQGRNPCGCSEFRTTKEAGTCSK